MQVLLRSQEIIFKGSLVDSIQRMEYPIPVPSSKIEFGFSCEMIYCKTSPVAGVKIGTLVLIACFSTSKNNGDGRLVKVS